jgi:hypothetical protein
MAVRPIYFNYKLGSALICYMRYREEYCGIRHKYRAFNINAITIHSHMHKKISREQYVPCLPVE